MPQPSPNPPTEIARPITVLLIDDEPDICAVWSMVLEMEGMTAVTASSGAEGLSKASAHRPDVIICDFMMPAMNGLEVCRAIRSDEHLRYVSLVLWSAARGINADGIADLVVEKPVQIDTFIGNIRSVLRRRAQG
jgi:CheY-like chemotaxis protein